MSSLFRLDDPFCTGCECMYQCTAPQEKSRDNNHNLVDCCFFLWHLWQSSLPKIGSLLRPSDWSFSSINRCNHANLFASIIALRSLSRLKIFIWFVAIFVAVEHALVHATLVAYELAHSRVSSRLRKSFAIIIAIDLARSFQRDVHRDWTEQ